MAELEEVGPCVDSLADVLAVLGDQPRMRTQETLQLLAERNPSVYREWTFADLKAVLDEAGAEPYKSAGIMVVSRARVLEALTVRAEDTTDSDSA